MDVVGRHHVIEHRQTKAFLGLENPVQITPAVARKLQEKFLLVAAMGDVPDVTGQEMAIGARHRLSLEVAFRLQKATSKLLNDAFYAIIYCYIKKLSWSDPGVPVGRSPGRLSPMRSFRGSTPSRSALPVTFAPRLLFAYASISLLPD
jgi:hypothetical protein